MSREPKLDDDISNLIHKKLEETEITQDLIVYSQRTAFVYGDEKEEKKQIPIEDFLINILKEKGPLTRGTLVSLTNIPRTTLYDVLSKMIMKGKIEKKPIRKNKRGRPKILFQLKK